MILLKGEQAPSGGRVLVLGTFDGVHRGHRELLRQGKLLASRLGVPLRVCSFDRHPLEVIRPELAPGLLNTPEEKADRMAEAGVDELRILRFDRAMADRTPEEFLSLLHRECEVRAVVAGWNYTFGRYGAGKADTLRRDGADRGYEAVIVPSVRTENGEVISSSAIREKLLSGALEQANEMLGYAYGLRGKIRRGTGAGGTEMCLPPRKLLPARGLYAGELRCGTGYRPAAVKIGPEPGRPSGSTAAEVLLPDGGSELTGGEAEVRLLKFFPPETGFVSPEAL